MKKLLILAAAAVSSYMASASVLLWLVDPANVPTEQTGTWETVQVVYGGSDKHDSSTLTALSIGGQNVAPTSWGQSMSAEAVGNVVTAFGHALADLPLPSAEGTQYFFIELYNASGNLVGYSSGIAREDLTSYMKEWSDLSNMTKDMQSWSPTSFTAVPEPTSGMLMLLGMALLGLRRKKAV